jgi:hypothetical protein
MDATTPNRRHQETRMDRRIRGALLLRLAVVAVSVANTVARAARILVVAAGMYAAAHAGAAQAQSAPYRVQRLSAPIQLDGRSDEAAWQAIEPLPAVSSFPDAGAAPSERTEFRLAYDDEYLYVAGRLYDRDPSGIRATSLSRDDGSFTNDWFTINLDTFRDRESMVVIGVSPAGVRTDAVFSRDGASSNFTWNAFWDAHTAVDHDGWHAEIRIPFSSLRFEERNGTVVMGVGIWRRIARRNEMVTWPAIDERWGMMGIFKASQLAELVLDGVRRSNPVYVTPYVLGGGSRAHALDDARTAWRPASNFTREAGFDVKYSPASNFTLDLTANTDFAQVEADDQQVNLTRFSLFFPEKRLFFQERASIFEYGLGGSDRLFYSRRIGLEEGVPVRIYGGGRGVGRIGAWDVGVLDMHTATADAGTSLNAGVLRLRRRVLNDNSYAGGIVTSRIDSRGATQLAGGVDALLRLFDRDYVALAMATSWVAAAAPGGPGAPSAPSAPGAPDVAGVDRLFARLHWERRGSYGLLYDVELAHVGAEFLPALGFLARRDHLRASGRVAYGMRMPEASRLLHHFVTVAAGGYRRNADGALESGDATVQWSIGGRSGRELALSAVARHEDLLQPFRVAGALLVPAGGHDFVTARISYTPANAALLRLSASAEAGTFFDGRRASASLSSTWLAGRHLQLAGTWQANRLDFPVRGEHLTTHIARVRSQVMVSSTLSGVAFAQFNSAADAVVINARVRWNPREGRDLYLVFNEGMNTDRFDYVPVRPLTDSRTLLVKYAHTTSF